MSKQVIRPEVYPIDICVFRGETLENVREDLFNLDEDIFKIIREDMFTTPGYTILTPNGTVVILLRKDYINDPGVIAHESFHAVEFIMDFIGCKLSEDSSEPYAYLLTYIVNNIHNYEDKD